MDFDSPDVEKDFPGLYASESNKKNQSRDSDCKLFICYFLKHCVIFWRYVTKEKNMQFL